MAVVRDIEPWDELLAGRSRRRAARHADRAEPPPGARGGDPRASCTRRSPTRCARAGSSALYSHQAEALHAAWAGPTIVTTGTASGKSLCFQLPTLDVLLPRRQGARAVPLPGQGARAGPGARAARVRRRPRAPGDLRRRHAARAARRDPPARQRRAHQPRHAAPRDPAQPPRVGRLLRQPRARRGRRGARLPRRVRLARRQRAAPAAAGRRRLRHRAALRAGQRHDRQPGRAGRAADRARGLHGDRPRRLAGRAAHDRDVEPADHRREARDPPLARWPRRPTCSPSWSPRARARSSS